MWTHVAPPPPGPVAAYAAARAQVERARARRRNSAAGIPALLALAQELPRGWRAVGSHSRPGDVVYENEVTGERIPWVPVHPAAPHEGESKDLDGPAAGGGGTRRWRPAAAGCCWPATGGAQRRRRRHRRPNHHRC